MRCPLVPRASLLTVVLCDNDNDVGMSIARGVL